MKILLVDDHPLVRRGIAQVLLEKIAAETVHECASAIEAMKEILDATWDLVILDLSLPGKNGLELLKEMKAARPRLPVLVLSTYPEQQFATRVLRAGAAGYLTKDASPDVLGTAVRKVLSGGKYISVKTAETMADELGTDFSRPIYETLSDREIDVMLRIAAGKQISQIAAELNLSVKTVSTYRSRVLQKTHLNNNADLMRYAVTNKLMD